MAIWYVIVFFSLLNYLLFAKRSVINQIKFNIYRLMILNLLYFAR